MLICAARLLGTILGDDTGSRLFWELVDTGLAEYAVLGAHEYQGSGIYMGSMCCSPDQVAENLQLFQNVLHEAENSGVTEEELSQAKNKICAQMILSSERPASRMFSVGNGWLQRRQYKTVREGVEAYRAVTVDDIRRVLTKYPLTTNTTLAVGPLETIAAPK